MEPDRTSPTQEAGLNPPLERPLAKQLRQAVLNHALAERRRVYAPLLHLGRPGACETVFPARPEGGADHSLRTDIVAAMRHRVRTGIGVGTDLARSAQPLVWLTRPGDFELRDVDCDWLTAAAQAYAEADAPLVFVIVTRHGWWDPRSGLTRVWQRLRPRSGPDAR